MSCLLQRLPANTSVPGIAVALAKGGPIILDGGLATQLEAQGHDISTDLWSAELLRTDPQAIIDAHRAFLDAGADCIISASYQASRQGLMSLGISACEADELIASSVVLADTARRQYLGSSTGPIREIYVAASIGPYGAVLHDGSEYTGDYDATPDEILAFHEPRFKLLDKAGADVLACETIPNMDEAMVLRDLLADAETPAWVSFACRDAESISDGTSLYDAASLFAGHPKVLAVGINCTAPQYAPGLIGQLQAAVPDKAIIVYPNSGETYEVSDNSWYGTVTPIECGQAGLAWRKAGAVLIGGCCRMGPEHITAMREQLR